MSRSDVLEKKWDAMSDDQKLIAYAKALLSKAEHRDSIPQFRKENNVANFWYEAKVVYAYGSGKR